MRNRKTIAPKESKKFSHLVLYHLLTFSLKLQSKAKNNPNSFRETLNAAVIPKKTRKKKKGKRKTHKKDKKIVLSFRQATTSNKLKKKFKNRRNSFSVGWSAFHLRGKRETLIVCWLRTSLCAGVYCFPFLLGGKYSHASQPRTGTLWNARLLRSYKPRCLAERPVTDASCIERFARTIYRPERTTA